MSEWGANLRAIRRQRGMSLRALAKAADMDFTYLSRIERGQFPPPGADTMRRLAVAMGQDADALVLAGGKVDEVYAAGLRARIDELQQTIEQQRAWLERKLENERTLLNDLAYLHERLTILETAIEYLIKEPAPFQISETNAPYWQVSAAAMRNLIRVSQEHVA